MLGPHFKKLDPLMQNKAYAVQNGWGVFQTHWGSPVSMRIAQNKEGYVDPKPGEGPLWVAHLPYVLHMSPSEKMVEPVAGYLRQTLPILQRIGVEMCVLHIGGVKGKTVEQVQGGMQALLQGQEIGNFLQNLNKESKSGRGAMYLLVENLAGPYATNVDLNGMLEPLEPFEWVSWCLDLHHAFAAGVSNEMLHALLKSNPPKLCHANYPGAAKGSGRDRHGWYHKTLEFFTNMEATVPPFLTEWKQHKGWEVLVKALYKKGVPLIIEGGSFEGEMEKEVKAFEDLLND